MTARPATTLAIDELVRELERLPAGEFVAGATEVIRAHPLEARSLEPYAFFSERHYTRNLIFKNDLFELLALCWQPGQQSAIHNHRDQQCWMTMGQGALENVNFKVHDRDPVKRTCRLEESTHLLIERDAPLAVDPDEPVHLVRNPEERRERALSVHLYSRPFDSCEVYCPERGIYMDITLCYHSQYGRVTSSG
jgi:hypothetical protein